MSDHSPHALDPSQAYMLDRIRKLSEPLRQAIKSKPRQSDDTKVICPNCVHEFTAVPVAVQTELRVLMDALWKACGDDEDMVNSYLESVR